MWFEYLTDPREHNPDAYTYLIHGILPPWEEGSITRSLLEEKIRKIRSPEEYYSASFIGRYDRTHAEEKLMYKGVLDRQIFYGDVGIILHPPDENDLLIAWDHDIGSPRPLTEEWVSHHLYKRKFLTSLLQEGKRLHNEAVLRGNPQTRIRGIVGYEGEEDAELVRGMLEDMLGEELPLIYLPSKVLLQEVRRIPSSKSPHKDLIAEFNHLKDLLNDYAFLKGEGSLAPPAGVMTKWYQEKLERESERYLNAFQPLLDSFS